MLNKELLFIPSGDSSIGKPVITARVSSYTIGMITSYLLFINCETPYPAEYFNCEAYPVYATKPITGNLSTERLNDPSFYSFRCDSPDCDGFERVRICWADKDGKQLSEWSDWVNV